MAKRKQKLPESREISKSKPDFLNIAYILLSGLMLAGILLILLVNAFNVHTSKPLVAHFMFIPIIIIWLIKTFKEKEFRFLRGLPLYSILAYTLYLVINAIFIAEFKFASWYYLRYFFPAVMLFFLGSQLSLSRTQYRNVFYILLLSIVIVALIGILSAYDMSPIPWVGKQGVNRDRICSTIGNPTWLATTLAIGLCLTAYFSITDKNMILRFLYLLAAAVQLWALYLTKARAGTLNVFIVFVGVGLYFVKSRNLRIKLGLSFLASILIVFLVFYFFEEKLPYIGGRGTMKIRKVIWQSSIKMWKSAPVLGVGTGNFQIFFPRFRNPFYGFIGVSNNTLNAENEILEIMGTAGVVGLILSLIVLYTWIRGFFLSPEILKLDKDEYQVFYIIGVGLFASLVDMMLGVGMRVFSVLGLIFFLAGIHIGVFQNTDYWGKYNLTEKPKLKKYVLGIALLICLGFIYYIREDIKLINAERSGSIGHRYMEAFKEKFENYQTDVNNNIKNRFLSPYERHDLFLEEAIGYLNESVKNDPYYFYAWYRLGGSYTRLGEWNEFLYAYYKFFDKNSGIGNKENYLNLSLNCFRKSSEIYDYLSSICPDYALLHHDKAVAYLKQKEFHKALPELVKAAHQSYIEAFRYMVEISYNTLPKEHENPETRKLYFEILPVMPKIYPNITEINFDLNDKNLLDKWINLKPPFKIVYYSHINAVISKMKDFEYTPEEIPYYLKIMESIFPLKSYDLDSCYRLYGLLLQNQGKLDEAEQAYLIAMNIEPVGLDNIKSLVDLYLLDKKDYKSAKKVIDKVVNMKRQFVQAGADNYTISWDFRIRNGYAEYYLDDKANALKHLSNNRGEFAKIYIEDRLYNEAKKIFPKLKSEMSAK